MPFLYIKCCFDCSLCRTWCEFYIAIIIKFLKLKNEPENINQRRKNCFAVRLEWVKIIHKVFSTVEEMRACDVRIWNPFLPQREKRRHWWLMKLFVSWEPVSPDTELSPLALLRHAQVRIAPCIVSIDPPTDTCVRPLMRPLIRRDIYCRPPEVRERIFIFPFIGSICRATNDDDSLGAGSIQTESSRVPWTNCAAECPIDYLLLSNIFYSAVSLFLIVQKMLVLILKRLQ